MGIITCIIQSSLSNNILITTNDGFVILLSKPNNIDEINQDEIYLYI